MTARVISESQVRLEPALLKPEAAAAFIGRSASWLRKRRFTDLKRLDDGLNVVGPQWVILDGMAAYRPDDLREWVARTATLLGRAGDAPPTRHATTP